ncbi:cysteine-rich repeat secretory protein 55-like [Magnolia sinica]|uniref:cysteine-rich repeat secretory protein 55-like n=1 Tax=Magnolia sinica TaxID=86752 RepID=UPI0026598D32|nr:cysteine-rich repeat secretory protein 55-like [Magnolia sinica]
MPFFYHFLIFFLLFPLYNADPIGEFCNKDKNISSSRTSTTIDRVLAQLVTKASSDGFATASSGGGRIETVYGLAQCRGDVSSKDCSACIADAAKQIRQLCPNEADARIWYDYCFLRYDTEDFVGKLDAGVGLIFYNVNNVTDPDTFNRELGTLVERIRAEALAPSNNGLGKGKTKISPFVTIYGLVQCTRDLSRLSCEQCLAIAIANFPKYCKDKEGCQINYSSCRARYEIYPFFFPLDSSKKVFSTSLRVLVYP